MFFFWSNIPPPPSAPLTLALSPAKAVFQPGEPLRLSLVLKNSGKTTLFVDKRFLPGMDESFGNEITLLVSGPNEEIYPFLFLMQPSRIQKEDIQELLPGRILEKTMALEELYPIQEPGTYRVQAVYNTKNLKADFPFRHGRIVSSPVTFTLEGKNIGADVTGQAASLPPDSAPVAPPAPSALPEILAEGNELFLSYQLAGQVLEFWEEIAPNFQAILWENASRLLFSRFLQSRENAIRDFTGTSSPWKVTIDPFSSLDWMTRSSGKVMLGNSAFQSPEWLGVVLAAVQLQDAYRRNQPLSAQEQHFVLAGLYQKILSQSKDWNLAPKEQAYLEELADLHQKSLRTSEPPAELKKKEFSGSSILYTPPFLFSDDSFARIGLFQEDKPLQGVTILIGKEVETGFVLDEIHVTDSSGHVKISIDSEAKSLLVVPYGNSAPFPQRIPILPSPAPSASSESALSSFFSPPQILELNTEEILAGRNLDLNSTEPEITLGYKTLPLLASSPSFLLTRIPPGPLVPMDLKIGASPGSLEIHQIVPFTIGFQLDGQPFHAGETQDIQLEEIGVPRVPAQISLDSPHLVFEDGGSRKHLSLEEKKMAAVRVKGVSEGSFRITAGLERPANEKAISLLEAMKSSLQDEEEKGIADQAIWALEKDRLGEAFGFLEKLRYQTLITERKALSTEKVLQAFGTEEFSPK